jgi:hypothetical protein
VLILEAFQITPDAFQVTLDIFHKLVRCSTKSWNADSITLDNFNNKGEHYKYAFQLHLNHLTLLLERIYERVLQNKINVPNWSPPIEEDGNVNTIQVLIIKIIGL